MRTFANIVTVLQTVMIVMLVLKLQETGGQAGAYYSEHILLLDHLGECRDELDTTLIHLDEARQNQDWASKITADQFSQALNGSWECEEEPTCQAVRPDLDDLMFIIASIGWEQASDGWAESGWALDRCARELKAMR
jgi:hypothetical protein